MGYVMIIIGWMGGYVNGPNLATQEFSSLERCEQARRQIDDSFKSWNGGDRLRLICVPR